MSEVHFCNLCNESIPLAEIQSRGALRSGSRALCGDCRELLRLQAGGQGSGAWAGVVLALLALGSSAWLYYRGGQVDTELRATLATNSTRIEAAGQTADRERSQLGSRLHEEDSLLAVQVESLRSEAVAARQALSAQVEQLATRVQVLEQTAAEQPGINDRLATAESGLSVLEERQRSSRATQESLRDELGRLRDAVQGLAEASPKESNPEGFSSEVSKLLRQLQDDDPELRYAALEKIQALQDERLLPHIYPLLADPYEFTRFLAAHTFGDWGAKPAVPHLIEALHDEVSFVRDAAVRALRRITGQNFGFEQDAPEDSRESAFRQWKSWWAANGEAFLAGG